MARPLNGVRAEPRALLSAFLGLDREHDAYGSRPSGILGHRCLLDAGLRRALVAVHEDRGPVPRAIQVRATTRAAEAGHAASAAPTAAPASAAVLGRSAMIAPPNRQNARTCSSAGTPCSR